MGVGAQGLCPRSQLSGAHWGDTGAMTEVYRPTDVLNQQVRLIEWFDHNQYGRNYADNYFDAHASQELTWKIFRDAGCCDG
jgi:hypothetical protein